MSATADIQTDRRTGIYSIPIQAVTTRMDTTGVSEQKDEQRVDQVSSDGSVSSEVIPSETGAASDEPRVVVFAVSEGKAVMKEVKTGIQDNNYIEITEGLNPEDEVIVAPYSAISRQLRNGLPVEVVPEEDLFGGDNRNND
jgi:HlyD family secretion protein